MNKRVKVPVQVKASSAPSEQEMAEKEPAVVEAAPPVTEQESVPVEEPADAVPVPSKSTAPQPEEAEEAEEEELEEWRDRALRLQAEIENFRKRQRRRAEERIKADHGRLLRNFLRVADDLERALDNADGKSSDGFREGVEVTLRSMMNLLKQEGVERIEAKGERFDPFWHEAVSTISHEKVDAEPNTVVEVTQAGYRIGDRLLRPARVVVAS